MSPHTLAQKIDCSTAEAFSFAREFYKSFPGIKEFQQQATAYCNKHGFVKTIMGRKRHIQGEKRKILSSIIQGSASDVVNQGLLSVCSKLEEHFQTYVDPKQVPQESPGSRSRLGAQILNTGR